MPRTEVERPPVALTERTVVRMATDSMSASEEADTAMALPGDADARLGVLARTLESAIAKQTPSTDVRETTRMREAPPIRTPAPVGVVTLPMRAEAVDAFAPTYPPPTAITMPIAPQISMPPPVPPVPSGALESNPPYERAFRAWSTPSTAHNDEPGAPLSYHVYTQEDLAQRSPSKSTRSPAMAASPSLGLRVCMILLGVCVVFGTAAAVIAGSAEDPKPRPAPTVEAPLEPPTSLNFEPPPSMIPAPMAPNPIATESTAKPPKGTRATPSGLRGIAPPPNPYGGSVAPSKSSHK